MGRIYVTSISQQDTIFHTEAQRFWGETTTERGEMQNRHHKKPLVRRNVSAEWFHMTYEQFLQHFVSKNCARMSIFLSYHRRTCMRSVNIAAGVRKITKYVPVGRSLTGTEATYSPFAWSLSASTFITLPNTSTRSN